jgi:hypothetical protein
MSGSGQRITGKVVEGFSRLLLLIGATVFFIGGKFLYEIKHRNFLASESIGILGGLFLMFLGWAIARPKGP